MHSARTRSESNVGKPERGICPVVSPDFLLQLELPDYQPFLFLSGLTTDDAFMAIRPRPRGIRLGVILKVATKDMTRGRPFVAEMMKGVIHVITVYLSCQSVLHCQAGLRKSPMTVFLSIFSLAGKAMYKKSVIDYAKAMAVTPTQLSDAVKRASEKSASFYIRQRLIDQAKRLVLSSSLSMKQVAYEVGFTDISYFSKFFRNQTEMNFTDYKRLWA